MTTTDRRDATDAQFADELARLDRLDVADEDTVERVARAIGEHLPMYGAATEFCTCGWEGDDHRCHQAQFAIDALKPAPGTDTVGICQALAGCVNALGHHNRRCPAVAGPQRDHDEEGGQ